MGEVVSLYFADKSTAVLNVQSACSADHAQLRDPTEPIRGSRAPSKNLLVAGIYFDESLCRNPMVQ